ncbi:hypothetical protein GHT06_011654 [Daphnia sinensis]|uniref:MATH domain-containing protein n=1 Tax=Daphnia sinensis TaxID=1820382 RepID=A0AAD5KU91_9CRUS|nr:hypothetical protein GHT06_011654 [Daphnia sinensis]
MSEEPYRFVESVRMVSRLVEKSLSSEWILENVERFESRVKGLTFESPVFGLKRGGYQWQLVMNLRDVCSSSLSLQLISSVFNRACVAYRFGIVNVDGNFEYEDHGQMNFEVDVPRQSPTILFSWNKLMEMKQKLFVNDQLRIECQITVLDYENVVV